MRLDPNEKLDIGAILEGLEEYRPRRKGWTWRRKIPDHEVGLRGTPPTLGQA